jgi:diguanylate cyclase (GGDEF)-like protein/PAS domain S-box-containing protein
MARDAQGEKVAADAALIALLEAHRQAALCAIGSDGVLVAMPDSVPIGQHQVVMARSPLDVVAPSDRFVVINAWEEVQSTGTARVDVAVRMTDEPDRSATLHLFDAQRHHGVFLGVFVPRPDGGEGHESDGEEGEDKGFALIDGGRTQVPPRFARARQNEVGLFLEVDEAVTAILGWPAEELVGQLSLGFIHPDDHERAIDNWMDMLALAAPVSRIRLRHRHRDGSWIWIEVTNQNLLRDPDCGYVVAEMVNVSDEMAAHEALRAREQLLQRLAESLPVGVLQVDADGAVVYTNNRLQGILGTPAAATLEEQLAGVSADDRPALHDSFAAVLGDGLDSDLEVALGRGPDGEDKARRRCLFSLRALTSDTGLVTGAIVCVADVTESARLRDELHQRATFDDITQCHNRASTMAALESLLSDADVTSRPAVIFVDLNRFKEVNDRFGHAAGDELLAVVARRLRRAVRSDDIVGRIGGDEFLIIRPAVTSPAHAMNTAKRLAETFRHQVRLKAGRLSCQASIGVAWSPDRGLDAESLVAMADAAMYEAKRGGCAHPILR